jgi:hypothetical protein
VSSAGRPPSTLLTSVQVDQRNLVPVWVASAFAMRTACRSWPRTSDQVLDRRAKRFVTAVEGTHPAAEQAP